MLWRIFGSKKVEVKGKRKLHNDDLHNLYCSIYITLCEEKRNTCRILVREPLERPRSRWENNIKKDRKEVGQEDADWINFA